MLYVIEFDGSEVNKFSANPSTTSPALNWIFDYDIFRQAALQWFDSVTRQAKEPMARATRQAKEPMARATRFKLQLSSFFFFFFF